jgi:hypothetical protein
MLHSGIQHVGLASFVLGWNNSISQKGRLPLPVSISHIFMGGDERLAAHGRFRSVIFLNLKE